MKKKMLTSEMTSGNNNNFLEKWLGGGTKITCFYYMPMQGGRSGGLSNGWLACWTLDRAVQVRALANRVIVLCPCNWARHFTLTLPQSPPSTTNEYR